MVLWVTHAIAFLLCLAAVPAQAQTFPDPRQRVDIKFDDAVKQSAARSIRVRDGQCRESLADPLKEIGLRQRIVDLAAREWEAFHFPVLEFARNPSPLIPWIESHRAHRYPLFAGSQNIPGSNATRMLRNGLLEDDAAVAARIGGYWAVVPNANANAIATQNVIWGKGGWPGAAWAQPWSAAFVSWVMCEAGMTRSQFTRAPSHAGYLTGFFQNAAMSAYRPTSLNEKPDIGDLICAGRDSDNPITSLEQAAEAARNDALMHCDIIVGLLPGRALLIGGNVRNAVSLSIITRNRAGRIIPHEQRPWFGLMKLNAPADAKAGLAKTPWQCLGQKNQTMTCLKNL